MRWWWLAIGLGVALATVLLLLPPGPPPPGPDLRSSAGEPEPPAPPGSVAPGPGPRETGPAPIAAPAPWELHVFGPGNLPIEGVAIAGGGHGALTDAGGVGRLPRDPGQSSLLVHIGGLVPTTRRELTDPVTSFHFPNLLPLRVTAVDGGTGAALPGTTVTCLRSPIPVNGVDRTVCPVRPGGMLTLDLEVRPPEGFALDPAEDYGVHAVVSRYARALDLTLVLRPEVPLVLSAAEGDGGPLATPPKVEVFFYGLGTFPVTVVATSTPGEYRLHGVAFLPGHLVHLDVSEGFRNRQTPAFRLGDANEPRVVTVVLPPPGKPEPHDPPFEGPGSNSMIGIGGSVPAPVPADASASAMVRVLHADGTPAVDTRVCLGAPRLPTVRGRTDGTGHVRFDARPAGDAQVWVDEPGYLAPDRIAIRLTNGETRSIVIREQAAGVLRIRVLDRGKPVPFARLRVELPRGEHVALDEGVQILALYTDEHGEARLTNLPPGKLRLSARFGIRHGEGTATAGGEFTLPLRK